MAVPSLFFFPQGLFTLYCASSRPNAEALLMPRPYVQRYFAIISSFGSTPSPGSSGKCMNPSVILIGRLARFLEISPGSEQYSMTNAFSIAHRKWSEAAVLMSVVKLWLHTFRPLCCAYADIFNP